jgi:hypothetical protein
MTLCYANYERLGLRNSSCYDDSRGMPQTSQEEGRTLHRTPLRLCVRLCI